MSMWSGERSKWTLMLVLGTSAMIACNGAVETEDQEAETNDALRWTGGNQLRIARSVLGSEFLLQASSVSQTFANMSFGLQSKIVRFELRDGELLMLDVGGAKSLGEYNSAIAKFPVVFQGQRSIGFDFNAGMRNSFLYSTDWHGSDYDVPWLPYDAIPFELKESYIVEAEQSGARFVISQSAQVDFDDSFLGKVRDPMVIKYYLQPYSPSASYTPLASPGHDTVSFFENTSRILPNGKSSYQVARFDPASIITYAVSAEVPADFRDAVKEGVLYWNTVMGRELVRVVDAPAGVHAPDADLNMIEWINWDDAGFAYADAQLDPRTGEVLHAQVFMTSSWAIYGKEEAFRFVAMSEEALSDALEKGEGERPQRLRKAKRIGARQTPRGRASVFGMEPAGRESMDDGRVFGNAMRGLSRMAEMGATDAQLLAAAQDVVRNVVAHEIGHTLGLRHNFAGSTASNVEPSQAFEVMRQYLANGARAPDGILPTSSIMDYSWVGDDFLVGDLIARTPLPYDVAAARALYDGAEVDPSATPLVCNDTVFGFGYNVNFTDCNAFDVGGSMLDNALQARDDFLSRGFASIIGKAIAYKTDPLHPRPVEAVTFDPWLYGYLAPVGGWTTHLGFSEVLSYFYEKDDAWGLGILSTDLALARSVASYPDLGELEEPEMIAAREEAFLADLAGHASLETLMAPLNQDWIDAQHQALDVALANPDLTSGVVPATGAPYSLSASEIEALRAKGGAFLAAIPKHYFASLVSAAAWFTTPPLDSPGLQILAEARVRLVRDGIFSASHQVLTGTVTLTSSATPVTVAVTLQVPLFEQTDRLAAADLLGGDAPQSDWLSPYVPDLVAEIEEYATSPFQVTWDELVAQKDEIPHPLRKWVEDLIAIHDAVGAYNTAVEEDLGEVPPS
ncbi:MAG: zinc-dependent metalloprotease [Deltaproteobacteria bacterium]|nr:zinc-dependent metalloprotease [Deltaproteobacteria bacterium]